MALSPDSCGIVADFGSWLARSGHPVRDVDRIIDVIDTLLDLRAACLRAEDHTRWCARDLETLLETLVPAHVALPHEDTVLVVVPALRLFLNFLDLGGHAHPDGDRVATLGPVLARHEVELPARMADSTLWGAAKKLFVAGYATGHARGRALPAVRLPDTAELALAAADAPSFAAALLLARWVGTGRPVTATGVLRLRAAADASEHLGLSAPPPGTRSARGLDPLHHIWSIACAADLVRVGRTVAAAGPLVRTLGFGRPEDVLRVWCGLWEYVVCGGPVQRRGAVSRVGTLTRELLRELYDHCGRWVPMGGLFELLSHGPDGGPRTPGSSDPALYTGMTLAHRMDDLRAFGVLEIRELVGGGAPFMAVRLTPLGLYGMRERFRELGVPAPLVNATGVGDPALPPLYVPPRTECALAARMSPLLAQVATLAEYVEARGPLPLAGPAVLRGDVARRLLDDLEIAEVAGVRGRPLAGARDVHALHRRWTMALATGFLCLDDGFVHVGDGLRVWREGGDDELVALAARAMIVVAEDNATFGEWHDGRWDLPEGLAASLFTGLVQLGGPLPVSLFVGLATRREPEYVARVLPSEPPVDDETFALARILDAADLAYEMTLIAGDDGAGDGDGTTTGAGSLARVRAGLVLLADRLAALGVLRRTVEGITLTGLGGALVYRMFREQGLPVATVEDYTAAPAGTLLGAMGGWPRAVAVRAFEAWVQARDADAALSELCAAAGAGGPVERLMLFAHVGEVGLRTADIDRAFADAGADPTLGPHVWNWRLTHGCDVQPATLRTLAWLTADNAAAALLAHHESAVLILLTEVTGAQGPGADVVFGEVAAMGHPCADTVLRFAETSHPDPVVAQAAGRALRRLL